MQQDEKKLEKESESKKFPVKSIIIMVTLFTLLIAGGVVGLKKFITAQFEPEMVFVEGGTFERKIIHSYNYVEIHQEVFISDFYISKYEITQDEWKKIMGYNPSKFKGDSLPVTNVRWDDANEFIEKLNKKTGKEYRLPTEGEWEFAARGGKKPLITNMREETG